MPPSHLSDDDLLHHGGTLLERTDRIVSDADQKPVEIGSKSASGTDCCVGELGDCFHRDRAFRSHPLSAPSRARSAKRRRCTRGALVDDVVVVRNVTRTCVLEGAWFAVLPVSSHAGSKRSSKVRPCA